MSNLGPQQQNQSFSGLLQIPGGVTPQLQQVQDGEGNTTGLWVSTTGATLNTADSFTISENGVTVPGAVPRLISDGFGDYVSVKDFGAVGDGVTDDTAAIQAALNAAAGKTLYFPDSSTYLVYALKVAGETTVDLGAATLLKRPATSVDQTVKEFTGDPVVFWVGGFQGAPLFYLTGNNIVIKNGTLDGNRANDTYATGSTWGGSFAADSNRAGILGATGAISSCQNLTVSSVNFINFVGVGINLAMTGNVVVEKCFEQNAGNMFANISGFNGLDVNIHSGELIFQENSCSGNRVFNNVPNTFVLDRKQKTFILANTLDETGAVTSGGCKTQDTYNTVVSNNIFIGTYIKPQSAPTFIGDSLLISNNTFKTSNPSTHVAGVLMGYHAVKSLVVSGNTLTNGLIEVERGSTSTSITNNSIRWDVAPTLETPVISGGNNYYPSLAGSCNIANNTIDLGGLDRVYFFYPASDLGTTTISNNVVQGADTLWYFNLTGAPDTSNEIIITNNTFIKCRAIGRINIGNPFDSLIIKGNSFLNASSTAPTPWIGSANRNIYIVFTSSSYTLNTLSIESNFWDASYGNLSNSYVAINTSAGVTVSNFIFSKNIMNFANASNGISVILTDSAINLTNVYVYDNNCVGDITFPSSAVITNTYIGNNSSIYFAGAYRGINNLSKKIVDINGTLSTTVGTAGGASALPATPLGYASAVINGTVVKIPYYNA